VAEISERVRRTALVIWTSIGALLLVAALVWAADRVRVIWLPLAFALGLVILLDPIVRRFQRASVPRPLGTLFAFLLLGGFLSLVGFLVVPGVQDQASEFGDRLPGLYDEVAVWLEEVGDRFGVDLGPVWTFDTLREWIQDPDNQASVTELVGGFGSGAGRLLRGVAETVAVVFLAPVFAFYMLVDLPRSRRLFLELTPPRLREEAAHVAGQVATALGAFVRGQLLVALIVGILSSLGLRLLDLPFWLIIGLAAGLLNMVPFVGPFFGGALATLVALLEGEPAKAALAVAIFVGIQQLDNHAITPLIQRTRVNLSPLVIVLALIVGGSVAGLLGVLVAVPAVTVVRIVAGHLWRTRVLGESWAEASEKMIEVTPPPERLVVIRRRTAQPRLFDTAELEGLPTSAVDGEMTGGTPGGRTP
jgi:predicted PurR-regulated permease PerM